MEINANVATSDSIQAGFKVAIEMRTYMKQVLRSKFPGIGAATLDDLIQDLSIEIAHSWHSFDPSRGVPKEAYFARLMGWRLKDRVKADKVRNHADLDSGHDDEDSLTMEERIPADTVASDELATTSEILSALDCLSEQDQAFMYDLIVEGLKYKEVAAKYNMPMGSVMSRKFRLVRKLRESLEKMGYQAPEGLE